MFVSSGQLAACLIDHQTSRYQLSPIVVGVAGDGERVYSVAPVLGLGDHADVTLVER